jgi:hypothetical protein
MVSICSYVHISIFFRDRINLNINKKLKKLYLSSITYGFVLHNWRGKIMRDSTDKLHSCIKLKYGILTFSWFMIIDKVIV